MGRAVSIMVGMVPKDDRPIANLMMVGLSMIGIGLLLNMASIMILPLLMVGIPLCLLGLAVTGFAIVRGLRMEKGGSKSKEVVQIADCTIIARFATNVVDEVFFNEDDILFDEPSTKLYVRVQPPQGRQLELKTNEAVWRTCTEGVRGYAVVQGDWLGSFTMVRGPGGGNPYEKPPTGNPYDK